MSWALATLEIRAAAAHDATAIADIYNQGITERRATFDTDDVTAADVGAWLGPKFPKAKRPTDTADSADAESVPDQLPFPDER